jgi:hypothetical protein
MKLAPLNTYRVVLIARLYMGNPLWLKHATLMRAYDIFMAHRLQSSSKFAHNLRCPIARREAAGAKASALEVGLGFASQADKRPVPFQKSGLSAYGFDMGS